MAKRSPDTFAATRKLQDPSVCTSNLRAARLPYDPSGPNKLAMTASRFADSQTNSAGEPQIRSRGISRRKYAPGVAVVRATSVGDNARRRRRRDNSRAASADFACRKMQKLCSEKPRNDATSRRDSGEKPPPRCPFSKRNGNASELPWRRACPTQARSLARSLTPAYLSRTRA